MSSAMSSAPSLQGLQLLELMDVQPRGRPSLGTFILKLGDD